MEIAFSELEERKIFAALQGQISVFTSQQSKNFNSLKILIEQLRVKQISNHYFDTYSFCLNIYRYHQTIQQLLEKIATKIKTISPLEKLSALLLGINKLFDSLETISNNKWSERLKRLEDQINNKTETHVFDSQLCSGCKQNRWHQLVKWQKHHINYLRIDDPYNYYQQGPPAKEFFGQQINQKVIQQKLAQLASGVEMEQQCLRKLIQEMDHQEKTAQKSLESLPLQRQNISFPLVPMLRSVFHKIRVKKETVDIGIQAQVYLNRRNTQIRKNSEYSINKEDDDIEMEKDKAQLKLLSELAEKSSHIKILEEKIELIEKNQSHLKMSNEVLMEQNTQLHRRNSILEVEINMAKVKPIINRLKTNHKTALIKPDNEINRDEKNVQFSTTNNTNPLQSTNYHDRSSDLLKTTKVKASGMFDSKFKPVVSLLSKAMLSPSYEEKSSTKSITSSNFPTSKIIPRDSGRSIESSFGIIKDNQFQRVSIHKNDFIKTNKTKIIDQNDKQIEMNTNSKSQRKLKQNGMQKSIAFAGNNRDFVRSENVSPENDNRNRRKGKFQDRQSLLKVLFNYEMKDNREKLVDFDFFKKSYQRFLVKMVSLQEEDSFSKSATKSKHLHKKSNLSIKQYLRHDMSNINEGLPSVNSTAENSILYSGQKQQISLEKIRQMQRYIIHDLNNKEQNSDFLRKGKILSKQQLSLITQILAYLIQMKVTKKQSYKNMREMILGINEPVKGKDEENQIKEKISNILRYHRGCNRDQEKGVCEHIKSFISDIIGLISL